MITRQVASHEQVIEIYDQLRLVLKKIGDNKVEYIEGHSDETVAQKIGCAVSSVINIRRMKFGNFNERLPNSVEERLKEASADIMTRVAAYQRDINQRIDLLQQRHDELQMKYDKLCLELSLNHRANVRHLMLGDGLGNVNGTKR
jgi:gas vesicle protein